MDTPSVRRLNRRDLLRFSSALLVGGAAMRPIQALAQQHGFFCPVPKFPPCGIDEFFQEFYPTSPFILSPFRDALPIPPALQPVTVEEMCAGGFPAPHSGAGCQSSHGDVLSTHSIWPDLKPLLYRIKLQVAEHAFTTSKVLPIDKDGNQVLPPDEIGGERNLPNSTIWGFNGTFPGPMINSEYGKPILVRFENHLDKDNGLDSGDFGAPCRQFMTHLHNAHTAPESDGNPNFNPHGYEVGQFVDNMYLNHPPGDTEQERDSEKQSFWWFHDHFEGYTGANVYKGLVGLNPIYDPKLDPGDERSGLRLPGIRTQVDGAFEVKYDIPLALFDVRLDDGNTPHKDFHNGCSETHKDQWGRSFFRHFPNHGFVGDIFTVNGKAYPYHVVERRKYRLRFLDASIARGYRLVLMRSPGGPKPARGMQGQWLVPDGQRCMRFTQIASEGGLLPFPIERKSLVLFPAKRREVIVDFSKYMDGSPTKKYDEVYLVNTMVMEDGRKPDSDDPDYKVPILKFIIGENAAFDYSQIPTSMRPLPEIKPTARRRTFELERGSIGGSDIDALPPELQEAAKEYEWSINSLPFNPEKSLAFPTKGQPEIWTIKSGGGWSHPMHFHQEEHQILSRNGVPIPRTGPVTNEALADDIGKEDTLQMTGSETVVFYRNFRTFPAFGHHEAKYVAHCHNLAHEDHSMMFGFTIVKPT